MASIFKTFNYTGSLALSSYTLPFTNFFFKPEFNTEGVRSNTRVLWDFGDGTSSEALTGQHAYYLPGVYTVTCHFYDRYGNVLTETEVVSAYNFITNSLSAAATTTPVVLSSGRIENPITVTRFTSYQSINSNELTIIPFASGANDDYFDRNLIDTYYGHLYPYSAFYQLQPASNNLTEFVEISAFTTSNDSIYYRLNGNTIQRCKSTDSGSFFCGSSGTATVFYKSDVARPRVDLYFGYQPGTLLYAGNSFDTVLSGVTIVPNTDYDHLSITSCGLEAEGSNSNDYSINKNKFANTKIGFVIKIKDSSNFTIKQPLESSLILSLSLRDDSVLYNQAVFATNTQLMSAELLDGIYKGTLTFPNSALSGTPLQNVYIEALYYPLNEVNYLGDTLALDGELIGYGSMQSEFAPASAIIVSGRSDYFNIYPVEGIYTIAKINEDIDMTQQFKDISLQPLFLDTKVLYDEFLANIFGTIDSSQTSIGKLTYEKISNFISNNKILDYSNINSLYSLLEELNIDTLKFSENNYRYPADLARLIDILSINKSRLFGSVNYYNEDFETRGYQDSEFYGKNLGSQISIFDTISAGQPIVSYERFGNVFRVLNTHQPVSITGSNYSIVNYTKEWGWGLVLPDTGYGDKISNYYTFYNHITTFDGTITDSIINFADPNNTLTHNISSYSDWSERDGIIANLISNQLYKGLNLFD